MVQGHPRPLDLVLDEVEAVDHGLDVVVQSCADVGATLDDDVKAVVHGLHFVEDKVKGTGMALYHKVHPPHHVDDHADYKVATPRR